MPYYQSELARIHHEAFGDYAVLVAPGVISRIADARRVVELGCGSGSLTRHLLAAGYQVIATDASPAMLDLADEKVPEARPRLLVLPDDPIPAAEALVAVGSVFNYLGSEAEIERGLLRASTAADLFITDLLDISYGESRPDPNEFYHEGDGWKLWTVNRLETPRRVVRDMTIETAEGVSHETHVNLLVDVDGVAERLAAAGLEVDVGTSFGDEELPAGFRVLQTRRS